jgi:leucyl aminopeptidase (aminopeptidase T)
VRVAPRIVLSPEERNRLLRWRLGSGSRRLRADIVLGAADLLEDQEIGRRLAIHRRTVARWRLRFLIARLRGLEESVPRQRHGRIPEETWQGIVRATVSRVAPDGSAWSTRSLAQEFGVSHMTVRRIWDSYGLRPVRHEAFPSRPDPVPPPGPWDVIGLYLRSPTAALVVSLHPILATRSGEDGPPGDPPPAAALLESSPGGAVSRNALAFRSLRPQRGSSEAASSRTMELLGFLGDTEARLPGRRPLRALATGIPASEEAVLSRWRVRHPRVELELVPDLERWKGRAVGELQIVGRGATSRRKFRGRAEVSVSLARSLKAYLPSSDPFVWHASRREIAEGEATYRLRYDLAVTGHPGFKRPTDLGPDVAPVISSDPRYRASARHVLRRYLKVRSGERVTIEGWTGSLAYANAFVLESMKLGARPLLLYEDEPTYWAAAAEVPAKTLALLGDHRRAALERTDVFVSFLGPSDRERFHALPSAVLFRLGAYQDALYDAAAKAGARAVQMAIGRVSEASGRMYGVDVPRWRDELLDASMVAPEVLHRRGQGIANRLQGGRELEIRHGNGSRLTLRLAGRKPELSDGTIRHAERKGGWSLVTLPAGVVTVAVDESHAEGSFLSNVASSTGLSNTVGWFAGGRWTFAGGRLQRFSYQEGQELFAQSYQEAPAGRDLPAAVSIGLNDRLSISPLLEDQALGTVGMHLGRNDHLGGRTDSPWWAWLFQRGSTLTVDGRALVRDGRVLS